MYTIGSYNISQDINNRNKSMRDKSSVKSYKKGSETYYLIAFSLRGYRIRQQGFVSKSEAQMVVGKIRAEILLGTYNPVEYKSKSKQSKITFEECLITWIKGCHSVKSSTKKNYQYTFNARILPVFGKKKVSDISGRYIDRFLIKIAAQYSSGYSDICYTLLRSILGWAERMEMIPEVPKFKKPKGIKAKPKRFLSMDEIKQMISFAYSHRNEYELEFINAFRFLVLTGLRIGELRAFRLEDVDYKNNSLSVSRRIYNNEFGMPKNGKVQSIPLHPELVEVIESQLELNSEIKMTEMYQKYNHKELFLSTHSGKRMSQKYFTSRLKRLALEALGSDDGISPHTLRRSLSDYLIEAGLNINQVSGMLRNTSVVMLKHYSQQNLKTLKSDYSAMEVSGSYKEKE